MCSQIEPERKKKNIKRCSPFGVVCPRKVVLSGRIVTEAASFLGSGNIVVGVPERWKL